MIIALIILIIGGLVGLGIYTKRRGSGAAITPTAGAPTPARSFNWRPWVLWGIIGLIGLEVALFIGSGFRKQELARAIEPWANPAWTLEWIKPDDYKGDDPKKRSDQFKASVVFLKDTIIIRQRYAHKSQDEEVEWIGRKKGARSFQGTWKQDSPKYAGTFFLNFDKTLEKATGWAEVDSAFVKNESDKGKRLELLLYH